MEQQQEPRLPCQVVTTENMHTSMVKLISEHLGYSMRVHAPQDGADEAIVEFIADRPCMPDGLALPAGDVRVLMLRPEGTAAVGAYFACSVDQIDDVEKAFVGLLRDHPLITILTNITYMNAAGEKCIQVSSSFSTVVGRMQAMWLDFSDYLKALQANEQVNTTIVPAIAAGQEPAAQSA